VILCTIHFVVHFFYKIQSPFVKVFLRKKSLFFKIIILRVLNPFVTVFKKNQNLKKNLKTTSNEKLLRTTSQKIDSFFRGEKKYALKY